jgi:hypothetical protein
MSAERIILARGITVESLAAAEMALATVAMAAD